MLWMFFLVAMVDVHLFMFDPTVRPFRWRNGLTGQSTIEQLTAGHISPFNDGQGITATFFSPRFV